MLPVAVPAPLDTRAQSAVHSAAPRYGSAVSRHSDAAHAAITDATRLEREREAAIERRDAAIVKMRDADGLTPGKIAKELGLSTSRVRQVLDLHDAAHRR